MLTDTDNAIDRLPPQNPEAEEAVLGSLLMDPEAVSKITFLTPGEFYREKNGDIYRAVQAVASRREPVDMLTVSDELKRVGVYQNMGGLAYLSHLSGVVPTALHVEYYARIVARCAFSRALISASGRIAQHAYTDAEPQEAMTFALEQLSQLQAGVSTGQTLDGPQRAARFVDMMLERQSGQVRYIPTGMRVDRSIGGVRRGALTVVGAPTGVGKTALLGEFARTMALNRYRGLFCSSEMGQDEIILRDAAVYGGVTSAQLEWNQDAQQQAFAEMAERGVRVYAEGNMTTAKVRREAAKWQAREGLDVVFVDYLQRMQDRGGAKQARYEVVQGIAQQLKSLAMDLNVAVVVAAQLGRDVRDEAREPRLGDFRESGGIENEADVALGIHRPGAYSDSADPAEAWLYVLKNRHGESDVRHRMTWIPQLARYTD